MWQHAGPGGFSAEIRGAKDFLKGGMECISSDALFVKNHTIKKKCFTFPCWLLFLAEPDLSQCKRRSWYFPKDKLLYNA